MKTITVQDIETMVEELCKQANLRLPPDVLEHIQKAGEEELSPVGREVLDQILENARRAAETGVSLCQDGGVTIVFAEIGQDVHIVGGSFEQAVHAGIESGYQLAHLRGSILNSPFHGKNTNSNTPGIIHTKLVPGNQIRIQVMPKGGGADNMSQLKMLVPAAGMDGIRKFVLDVVEQAGPNACPPLIVGVGIGGTFDSVAQLAKHALLRSVGEPNSDSDIAKFELELLHDVNKLGIGPMGLGGTITAMAVHIETHPLHMASLPVAVNLQCHSARVQTAVL